MIMMMTEQFSRLCHLLTQTQESAKEAEDAATDTAKHQLKQPHTNQKHKPIATPAKTYIQTHIKNVYIPRPPPPNCTHKRQPTMTMMMTEPTTHPRHLLTQNRKPHLPRTSSIWPFQHHSKPCPSKLEEMLVKQILSRK